MFPTAHGVLSQGGVVIPPEPAGGDAYTPLSAPASHTNNARWGFQFKPTQNIKVTRVGGFTKATATFTVRMFAVSDGSQILTQSVSCVADEWVWVNVDGPALATNAEYTIDIRDSAGNNRAVARWDNPATQVEFDPAIVLVRYVTAGGGVAIPATATSELRGAPNFTFESV